MMDIRRTWADRDAESKAVWDTIHSRVEQGNKVRVAEAWLEAIPFEQPSGSTGYFNTNGDILGVLPFYDFLYVPIGFGIKDQDDFKRANGIDVHYFLDLVEARRVIPVFPDPSKLYSDFVAREIWGYLEARGLNNLLAWQINTLCIAFQSISGVMLPWSDPSKSPWWTEMMIKASALDGRLIADFPKDVAKFASSKVDFDKLPREIKSNLGLLDAEKLDFISRALRISFSNQIPPSRYVEILDSKSTQALRHLFESSATIEEASGEKILELCKQYNEQVEYLAKSKGYRFAKLTSDLFTKHVLAVSLGVAGGAVSGPLPGLAGLIAGEITPRLVSSAESKLSKLMESGARSFTCQLASWLGKDSDLVHLCLARETLSKS